MFRIKEVIVWRNEVMLVTAMFLTTFEPKSQCANFFNLEPDCTYSLKMGFFKPGFITLLGIHRTKLATS